MMQSLQQGFSAFFAYIPQLLGAIVILIVGYIVAKILQAVTTRVLGAIGFEHWMERGGIKQFFDRADTGQTPTTIMGKLVFWFVFIIAIVMATDALGIRQVSAVLSQLIAYIPNVIAAVLIIILAALLANFVAGLVRGATGVDILATAARAVIIVYAVFAALTQLGIAVQLTAPTFLIILGAVALAAAIAFGLGSRDVAKDIVEKAYHRRDEARQKIQQQGDSGRSSPAEGTTESGGGADGRGEGGGASANTVTDGRHAEGHDLVKMSASSFVLEDRSWDLRGRKVYDRDGQEIGEGEDLYADREEQRVRFLSVSAGGALGLGKKHFLIPFEAVSETSADRVTLSWDRDTVTNAPQFDEEAEPDREYQRTVYRHYGYA
jgi:sporulation protein YlmC with PRC-barrel domain